MPFSAKRLSRPPVKTPSAIDKLVAETMEPGPAVRYPLDIEASKVTLAEIQEMVAKLKAAQVPYLSVNAPSSSVPPPSPLSPLLQAAIEDNFVLVRMSMNMLAKLALLGESVFGGTDGKGRDVMGYRVTVELGEAKEGVTNNRGMRESVYTPTISIEPVPEEPPPVTMSSVETPKPEPGVYEPDPLLADYTYEGALPYGVEKPK